jgi:hypothetical protein
VQSFAILAFSRLYHISKVTVSKVTVDTRFDTY